MNIHYLLIFSSFLHPIHLIISSSLIHIINLAGVDWTAGGNYTEEEMVVALIVVGIIMSVSLLICACQCYQKVLWEIENTHIIVNKVTKRPMPPAPYNRDAMA